MYIDISLIAIVYSWDINGDLTVDLTIFHGKKQS